MYHLCFSGKAPQPRVGYQMPEPDGCSTSLLGFQVPNSVCVPLSLLTLTSGQAATMKLW